MKKLYSLILISSLFSISVFSQTIDNMPIAQLDSEFIIVTNSLSLNVLGRVVIDFGNGMYVTNLKRRNDDEAVLKSANGKNMKLVSTAQAINLITSNGYDLIDTNTVPYSDANLMTTYLLAKKVVLNK